MYKKYIICIAMGLGLILLSGADAGLSGKAYGFSAKGQSKNKAAHITIVKSHFEQEAMGSKASNGHTFLILETEWQNIHPKQKVAKDRLEGKTDRTMGVGGFGSGFGGGKKKQVEYVDADVAYQIPKLFDHVYLLADGLAFALHNATEKIAGGYKLRQRFTIAKHGEIRKVTLVYMVPAASHNLAFRLFDYQYGHVVVPIKGRVNQAQGTGEPPGKSLDWAKGDKVALAALDLHLQPQYMGRIAPAGWTYAVARLAGKSLSGGSIKDIVQIKPKGYTWVTTDGGYLYPCTASASAVNGSMRFTPDIYQLQELGFLVPVRDKNFRLGVRAQNQVLELDLGTKPPKGLPEANASHRDGDVMEILVFGTRQDQGQVIVDMGIRSLYDRGGLEIQMAQQFFLRIAEEEYSVDTSATAKLMRLPPSPFIVPPGRALRFELAFDARGLATALRYRGYKSEKVLNF